MGYCATHAYCELCGEITPATFEPLESPSGDAIYLGGDVVCSRCRFVIATLYRVDDSP